MRKFRRSRLWRKRRRGGIGGLVPLFVGDMGSGLNIATLGNLHWWLQDSGLTVNEATQQAEEWTPSKIEAGRAAADYKLTQDTVSWQPLRVSGAGGINGEVALQFDGLQDYIIDADHAAMGLTAEQAIQVLDDGAGSPTTNVVVDDGGATTVTPVIRQALTQGACVVAVELGSTDFNTMGDQVIFGFGNPAGSASWQLGIEDVDATTAKVFVEGVSGNRFTGDTLLAKSTTYVFRVEHDDTDLSIWVNGVAQTLSGTEPGWIGDIDPVDNSSIGARVISGTTDRFFEGKVMIGGSGAVWFNTNENASACEEVIMAEAGVA